ncbi:rCG33537 [Rattus norvegicus]|uniref:RCG33537 n=1 Tax=Rattus norvegicus TaxID=10116 RepID=A6HDJ5_RAT|nr:rCG33537 [Rattus norvegicus]
MAVQQQSMQGIASGVPGCLTLKIKEQVKNKEGIPVVCFFYHYFGIQESCLGNTH